MKRRGCFGAAGVILAALMLAGCSSNKIVMKPGEPQLGGRYDKETGALNDIRTRYSVSDEQVVAWVEFKNAAGAHTARFKWFNPEELLVQDSGPIAITPDAKLYAWRRVWSAMPIKDSAAIFTPGKWSVEVYFDKKKIEVLKFVVKDS